MANKYKCMNKYTSLQSVLYILNNSIILFNQEQRVFLSQGKVFFCHFQKHRYTTMNICGHALVLCVSPLLSDQTLTTLVDTEDKPLPCWIYIKRWSPFHHQQNDENRPSSWGSFNAVGFWHPFLYHTSLILTQTHTSKWMLNQHLHQTQVNTSQPTVSTALRLTSASFNQHLWEVSSYDPRNQFTQSHYYYKNRSLGYARDNPYTKSPFELQGWMT